MKIIQLVPTFLYGDAIGNDITAIDAILRESGYKTHIYAESIGPRVKKGIASLVEDLPALTKDDVAIYHMATGSAITYDFGCADCRKVLVYHNITPPAFFLKNNLIAAHQCRIGYSEVRWLKDRVDYCIADSEWNKNDLKKMGYICPIDVIPVIVPFEDYLSQPDSSILEKYKGVSGSNILFTGRVVPNKCHEDIIKAFACYKQRYDERARLFLVGVFDTDDSYYQRLISYISALKVDDVFFLGHISFSEILAYYSLADIFLCQSEHEGFCVPLLEAMMFDVPIIAYNSTAVSGTLNGCGVLMADKNPSETAAIINRVMIDEEMKEGILARQRARLKAFEFKKVRTLFLNRFESFLKHSD